MTTTLHAPSEPPEYATPWQLDTGVRVKIRPIRPDDEPLVARFHATISERSVYMRYFHLVALERRTEHARLERLCSIDPDREIALVAEHQSPRTGAREILAIGRLVMSPHAQDAEFAVLISDAYQGHGLGTELIRRLVEIGRAAGLARITGEILPENGQMLSICRLLGFDLRYCPQDGIVHAELPLKSIEEHSNVEC